MTNDELKDELISRGLHAFFCFQRKDLIERLREDDELRALQGGEPVDSK